MNNVRATVDSVRQRLLNLSKSQSEDFQVVLTRYAIERILYRLSMSPHESQFVLKGATLFSLWASAPHRATRDLDLLAYTTNTQSELLAVFSGLLTLRVENDGLSFDTRSLKCIPIRDDNEHGGLRITFESFLGVAKIPMQVDVGFGDAVTPNPLRLTMPSILGFPAPTLSVYAKETVVAEKFHAMVVLGMTNSRMKDFFDIEWLAANQSFEEVELRSAIHSTFKRRSTLVPQNIPLALTAEFYNDASKRIQWSRFLERINKPKVSLQAVTTSLATFLAPFIGESVKVARWTEGQWL